MELCILFTLIKFTTSFYESVYQWTKSFNDSHRLTPKVFTGVVKKSRAYKKVSEDIEERTWVQSKTPKELIAKCRFRSGTLKTCIQYFLLCRRRIEGKSSERKAWVSGAILLRFLNVPLCSASVRTGVKIDFRIGCRGWYVHSFVPKGYRTGGV